MASEIKKSTKKKKTTVRPIVLGVWKERIETSGPRDIY